MSDKESHVDIKEGYTPPNAPAKPKEEDRGYTPPEPPKKPHPQPSEKH